MATRRVTIGSPTGLHARPAKLLTEAARNHSHPVRIGRDEAGLVDASSILAVMSLGVRAGEEVLLTTEGDHADQTLAELADLLADDS